MAVRWAVAGAFTVVAVGLLSACGEESGTPVPVSSAAPSSASRQAEIERSQRIHQRLLELGCTTNSCIQTYFACMDGYLTGQDCDFYHQHPPE